MSSFHIGKSTQNLASQNEFWLFRKLTGLQSVALLIALVLIGLLVVPVGKVIFVAFQDPSTGAATLQNFADFFATPLFRESFWNSF